MRRLFFLVPVFCAVAAAVAPPCDVEHQSGDAVCASFCNYECGFYNASHGERGQPVNLTVYRLTPKNVSGLLNKNTGDAPGDVSFVLSKKNLTQHCLHYPDGLGCHTDNANEDIYGTFVVEVDGQWGPYQMCNPADGWDTKDWRCGLECLHPTHADGCPRDRPAWGPARNGSTGRGGYQCWCERTYKTAGREKAPTHHGYYPTAWPPQCSTGAFIPPYASLWRCVVGTAYKVLRAWSEASALTMACKACDQDTHCTGWRLGEDGKSATLFQGKIQHEICLFPTHSASKNPRQWPGLSWFGVGNVIGYWYSMTTGGGECENGVPLGTNGCTWHVVEEKAYKNASCVDAHVDMSIEAYGKICFDTCPHPLNRTTDCYLDCYRNVIMGDASLNLSKMPSEFFVEPWVKAIHEDDLERGGCLPVEPSSGPLLARPPSGALNTMVI